MNWVAKMDGYHEISFTYLDCILETSFMSW
jgi:hypothetical protein